MKSLKGAKPFDIIIKPLHAIFFVIFITVISLLKGFNLPIVWAQTHYVLNYDFFWIRRGLFGEVLSNVLGDFYYKNGVTDFIAITIMMLAVSLLLFCLYRHSKKLTLFTIVGILFFSSPNFVFFIHTVGYFDHLGLLASLLIILFYKQINCYLLSGIVFALMFVLIFVHEAQPVFWGPSCFWILFIKDKNSNFYLRILKASVTIVLPIILGLIVLKSIAPDKIIEPGIERAMFNYKIALQDKVDFKLYDPVFKHLTNSYEEGRNLMTKYWSKPKNWKRAFKSFLLYYPTILCLLFVLLAKIDWSAFPWKQKVLFYFILFISAFSPLILNLYGFDIHRWNSLVAFTLLLLIILSSEIADKKQCPLSSKLIFICLLVTCLNLSSDNFFFEGEQTLYPFFKHLGL